jgi:hypothetical protein
MAATPAVLTSSVAADLGLAGVGKDESEEERRKRLLQQQRNLMGGNGMSVYGAAASSIFGPEGLNG